MKVLVECTFVFEHPDVNTGIQRVVRNIINNLPEKNNDLEFVPVIMKNDRMYKLNDIGRLSQAREENAKIVKAIQLVDKLEAMFRDYKISSKYRRYFSYNAVLRYIAKILAYLGKNTCRNLSGLLKLLINDRCLSEIKIHGDERLVLLDSSWHAELFQHVERLHKQGVRVTAVIYDTIPIRHPQFCEESLITPFSAWLDKITTVADSYLSISNAEKKLVQSEISERNGTEYFQDRSIDYFYLGADFRKPDSSQPIRENVLNTLNKKISEGPVYIAVGTVEPRKNHRYMLDEFDLLWEKGSSASLVIIGRVGWMSDALIKRINKHDRLNKNLFFYNDLNDSELELFYSKATALLFTSKAEGFGLPIVEALQKNIPVICSDIEVFREIGQDYCFYVDIDRQASLAGLIEELQQGKASFEAVDRSDWQWLSWAEATEQFCQKVALMK